MDSPRVTDADLPQWRSLWEEDRPIAVPPRGGIRGRLIDRLKSFLRRFVTAPQQDLWERQRLFNLLIQHHLEGRAERDEAVGRLADLDTGRTEHVERVHKELLEYADGHEQRLGWLEETHKEGLDRIARHHDAVYALLDHKLDEYRRQALTLRAQLVSLLEVARTAGPPALGAAVEEQAYLELERRHRGTEDEIAQRIEPYVPFFEHGGEILDLGCGRGEALELFRQHGLAARGVDGNAEMVAHARGKGLEVACGDLFEELVSVPEETLAGVVSFHVIEHLSGVDLDRLVKLSWRALRPGGVLVLETPSPLSIMVGARNFWLDPTHRRPVHPESLKLAFELAGFEDVERIDRQPFGESDRLREMPTAELPEALQPLAHEINLLRDQLDGLLFGFQDYGMVGRKPR